MILQNWRPIRVAQLLSIELALTLLLLLFVTNHVSASGFPIVLGTNAGNSGLNVPTPMTTTHNITLVSQRAVNDTSIFCIDLNSNPAGAGTITYPSGWTLIINRSKTGGAAPIIVCMYRVNQSGDSDLVVLTTSGSIQDSWVVYLVTNIDISQRIYAINSNDGISANPLSPSFFSYNPGLLISAYVWGNSAFCKSVSSPANMPSFFVKEDAQTNSVSADSAMASAVISPGRYIPLSATLDSSCTWVATIFFIQSIEPSSSPVSVITAETILLHIMAILLVGIGIFKYPYLTLLGCISGIVGSVFIYRDIGSILASGLGAGSYLLITIVKMFYVIRGGE